MFVRHHDIIEWAREFHLLALCIPGLPHIPLAAALDNPGKNIAENTLLVVDALLEQGFKIVHFVCDMAYLPNTKMEEWPCPCGLAASPGSSATPERQPASASRPPMAEQSSWKARGTALPCPRT